MPPREPFSTDDSAKAAAEQSAQQRKQLVLDYKNTFAGERGQRVLADLKKRFGFGKWAASDTDSDQTIMRRVFMQGPLYHIEEKLNETFAPKRRGKAASTTAPQ